MHWGASGRLYLALHNCSGSGGCRYGVWVGTDGGASWIQLAEAPALPVHAIATGPTEGGSGEAVYFSTAASRDAEDVVIPPDLYVSRDGGATWQNLGAIPGGAAKLATAADAPDRLWAANYGVKRLDASVAPTATPNLTRELLANRSFEYQGVWRIPDTRYDAGYSQDQHYAGNWSMRTGIVTATVNVHSFSDFSQDVTLPATGTVTLRLHRWTLVGAAGTSAADGASGTAEQAISLPEVATLDDFYRLLDTRAGDLQYVLLIEQPGGTIHYLAAGLANGRTWEEKTFDLNAYLGKQVRLQFGTYNDGAGLTAAQYFDVMELQATAPLQPTATPTVEPTALPAGTPQAWLPYLGTGRAR
jgi:hypothetical protein